MYVCMSTVCIYIVRVYIMYSIYIMYSVCIYTVHCVYSVCNVSISIVLQLEIQMHLPLCMYCDQILVQSQEVLVCLHFFQQELIMRPYHASFLLTKNGMLLLSKHSEFFSDPSLIPRLLRGLWIPQILPVDIKISSNMW